MKIQILGWRRNINLSPRDHSPENWGRVKKINAFFFPVQLRFIDARVTLTYKRERMRNPSGPASLHQISNPYCFDKREHVPIPSGRASLRSELVGGGGAKGRSFTSRRGKGRGPCGGRLAVPRGFRSGPDNARGY